MDIDLKKKKNQEHNFVLFFPVDEFIFAHIIEAFPKISRGGMLGFQNLEISKVYVAFGVIVCRVQKPSDLVESKKLVQLNSQCPLYNWIWFWTFNL